jgi:hypothetical protein
MSLNSRRNRRLPAQRCDYEFTADSGFGDPETVPCREAATHRSNRLSDGPPWAQPQPYRVQVCDFHAHVLRTEHADAPRVYRYRTLRGA